METIIEILNSLHPRVDFASETGLVDRRIIDSFDIITLVQELSDAFDVEIDLEYLEPENFNSVQAIAQLLERLGAIV
jgi:acyl carrier protein